MKIANIAALAAALISAASSQSQADDALVNEALAEAVAVVPYCKKMNPEKAAEFDSILAKNKASWDAKTKAYAESQEFAALVAAKIKEMETTTDPADIAMLKALCARSGALP
jgi:hypothetical protein